MMTAQKWHEYNQSYKKYGYNFKPRKEVIITEPKKQEVAPKDKIFVLSLALFIGVVAVAVIIITAVGASIKYNTNELIEENHNITGEIENLTVEINRANNISTIEERAKNELGMLYPDPAEFIYIEPTISAPQEVGLLLREAGWITEGNTLI